MKFNRYDSLFSAGTLPLVSLRAHKKDIIGDFINHNIMKTFPFIIELVKKLLKNDYSPLQGIGRPRGISASNDFLILPGLVEGFI